MELTTEQLMKIFGVTYMTIYNWREGRDKKKSTKLPFHKRKAGKRHRVFFKWHEVKEWADYEGLGVLISSRELKKIQSYK